MKAAGLAGVDAPKKSQVMEYGAGTAYFADNVRWIDSDENPLFGGKKEWQWVVTDLQQEKVASMMPVTSFKSNIKFATIDAASLGEPKFVYGQELLPECETRAIVANYLLGCLRWSQYKIIDGNVCKAHFQTSVKLTTQQLLEYRCESIQEFLERYKGNFSYIEHEDWIRYQNAVSLKPVYMPIDEASLSKDVLLALELSGGKEAVVNDTAIEFLRNVLKTLPPEGVFFGNEYAYSISTFENKTKKKGCISPLILGGTFAIGVNVEHIKLVLEQEGYSVHVAHSTYTNAYALLCITKRENEAVSKALVHAMDTEDTFMDRASKALKPLQEPVTDEQRTLVVQELRDIVEQYGSSYGIALRLSLEYEALGDLSEATKQARLAYQLSPHDTLAENHYSYLSRRSIYAGLF